MLRTKQEIKNLLKERVKQLMETRIGAVEDALNLWGKVEHTDKQSWWYIPPKGGKPPKACMVAHIDTVDDDSRRVVKDLDAVLLLDPPSESSCLGADDRAGVVASTFLWEQNPEVALLLTNYEESGRAGVANFCDAFESLGIDFSDLRLFISIDRKGTHHFVDYAGNPYAGNDWVRSFGWEEEYGSFSDIATLQLLLKVPAINIATGYYHEHTLYELLVMSEWVFAIDFVQKLIDNIAGCPVLRITGEIDPDAVFCYDDIYRSGSVL